MASYGGAVSTKTKKGTHTQCLLVSFDHDGSEQCSQRVKPMENGGRPYYEYVAWIPSSFAEKGRSLRIDDVHGNWYVREVHGTRPSDWVNEKSRDYTKQRKASDI